MASWMSVRCTQARAPGRSRPCNLEAAGNQHCCCRSDHPSEKPTPGGVHIVVESAVQAMTKSQRHFQHALVTIQLDYVTSTFQHRTALFASADMFFDGRAEIRIGRSNQIV